jgi:deoxyribonuclease-4
MKNLKREHRELMSNIQHAVGAHCSIAGGHDKALELGKELGCEVVQIFTKNNMQWSAKAIEQTTLSNFSRAKKKTGINRIFAHAGYLINLASVDRGNLQKSQKALLDELERCSLLGLPFIVLHPGAHMGAGERKGLDQVVQSINWVLDRYEGDTQIALESTAGQGTVLGAETSHLAYLIKHSQQPNRLAICLDTCHLFAAGYDVRKKTNIESYLKHFRQHLSWEKVLCLHLNDSKGALGQHLDRHEVLGRGQIGWPCFETILTHPAFAPISLCLETPKGKNNINDRESLTQLKRLRT